MSDFKGALAKLEIDGKEYAITDMSVTGELDRPIRTIDGHLVGFESAFPGIEARVFTNSPEEIESWVLE